MSTISIFPPCCWQIVEAVTSFRSSELLSVEVHARSSSNEAQDYWAHCMKSVQDIGNLVGRGLLLNQRQCQDLCSKVTQTAKNVQKLVLHFRADSYIEQFRPCLKNLYGVLERSRLLINDCSRADWCQASVFQMQNGEAFSEILMDLGLCYNVIYEQARGIVGPDGHVQEEDLRKFPTFLPASKSEVLEDQKTLRLRLEQLARSSALSPDQTRQKLWIQRSSFSSYDKCLARYLLGKLEPKFEECMKEGLGMSNTLPWPNEMESQIEIIHWLGHGGFASVLHVEWLGIPSAMKIFKLDGISDTPSACGIFRREAEILARLNHPHIVKFFCCGHDTIKRQYYIGMELMEMNLFDFIRKFREEKKPLAGYLALHTMIQVARGMCYLHDQGIAHRDIKPHNVVISRVPSDLDLVDFLVKLVDFGLAKTRVHVSKSNTPSQNNIGTTNYRAPEVFCKARDDFRPEYNTRVNWFKADVYSFALTCTELLTLEAPFQDLPPNKRCDVSSRLRWKPKFPSECPQELVALLEKCLDTKPQLRPSFREICITLERYKYDLLTPVLTPGEEGHTYIDTFLTHHSHLRMQWTAKIPSAAGVKSKAPMLKSMQCIEDIANLVGRGNLLNGSQCQDLSSKLYKTVKNVEELISHPGAASTNDPHSLPALENFYRISEKSRLLVSDCSRKDWCRAASIQIQNEEAFREILVEMGLCYNVIYEKAREIFEQEEGHLQTEDLRQLSTFEPADGNQVVEDQKSLQQRLEKHAIDNNSITDRRVTGWFPGDAELSNDQCALVGYLLHKLKLTSSGDLKLRIHNALLSANETETQVEIIGYLGKGASGTVLRARWLGLPCAMKYFRGDVFSGPDPKFLKEAAILASLNHPNVVKFFCCGHDPQKNELSIGMEAMEMDLHHLLLERGEKEKPFPFLVALDIMLQIASGMCYLHDMKIAHRDLKPHNVLISNVSDTPYLGDRYCVKLCDFGESKVFWDKKEGTSESARCGTTSYRAPELMSPQPQRLKPVQWFKADVFGFAVTCSEILTLQKAFVELPERPLHHMVLSGYRPYLPRDCPPQLAALIHEGWDINPRSRPSFEQICTRLEMCKYDLLSSRFTADADVQQRRVEYPNSHKYIETTLRLRSQLRRRQHVATQVAIEHTVEAPLLSAHAMRQRQEQPRPTADSSTSSDKPESSTSRVNQSITLQLSMSFHVSVESVAGNIDIRADVQKACEAFLQWLNRGELDQGEDFREQAAQSIVAYLREAHPKHNVLVLTSPQLCLQNFEDCASSHIVLQLPVFFGEVPQISFDVFIFSRGSITLMGDNSDTIQAFDGPSFHRDGQQIEFFSPPETCDVPDLSR